jgi:signal transduction histidine kinase
MGVIGSPGPERPRYTRGSVRFTFVATVAGPVLCLMLLWGVVASVALGGASSRGPGDPGGIALIIGTGLAVVLVSAALMGLFARRLSRDISALEATARHLAEKQLPQLLERLRHGEQGVVAEVPLRPRTRITEITRTAAAIASLQHTAVAAAAGEASLRHGIGQVFVSLARRNQSLLQRQLRLIDALEQKASDPATLADLFPLDHLTTRMRRHAEGLIILSGAAPGRSWSEPVPVIDIIRGAVAEVEDYKRVMVLTGAEDSVAGLAAADMIHLLAELIENATLSSPSGTRVEVRAERVANGFAIEIDDRGLGIETGQLKTINQQLASPPDFDLANADQLGLFVVGKLAARHGARVSLRPSPYGGTTAVVLMPNSIVVSATETDADTQPDIRAAIGRPAGLDLRSGGALALAGQRAEQPSLSAGAAGPAGPAGPAWTTLGALGGPGLTTDGRLTDGRGPGGPAPEGRVTGGRSPGASQTGGTYRGLPRRIRQANLSPHLKDSPAGAGRPAEGAAAPLPAETRTPEEARDVVASLQSGWQRGRETDADPVAGAETAGRHEPEVDSEES